MKPERMVNCRIVAPKSYLSKVIDVLYNLGLYDITPHLKEQGLDIGGPLNNAEELSTILVKIRSILAKYPQVSGQKNVVLEDISTLNKEISEIYGEFIQVETGLAKLKETKEEIHSNLVALAILKKLGIDIRQLKTSKNLTYFFGTITKSDGLEEKLQKVSDDCSVAKNSKYVLLVAKKSQHDNYSEVLNEFGFVSFPYVFESDVLKDVTSKKSELKKVKEEIQTLERRNLALKSKLPWLTALTNVIHEEIRKQELPLNFAVTKSSFVAQGWIPKAKTQTVKTSLEEQTKNKVSVTFKEPTDKEDPPIKLHNSKLVTPFEFLMRLYDLPKYNEIDPSSLLFLTFPFFFGFMLGDFGYGFVLFFLFMFLKKKIPAGKQLLSVLMFAAVVSMIFGLVYGEVFGFEHVSVQTGKAWCDTVGVCLPVHELNLHGQVHHVADFPRMLNRAHGHMDIFGFEILTILVIGAIIGFIHMNLGFLFGFINELQSHGFKHAFMAKISWMVIELGIILLVMAKMSILIPVMVYVGIGVAILGVILLWKGEGIQGVVELPALFSNTLSYMRLGAVGLASVGLAVVVNEELAMPFIQKGGWFILIGMLIMFLGHGINILLGVIGPFLHGVRLHYVEFFSKFFHGGGKEYDPFTKNDKIDNGGK